MRGYQKQRISLKIHAKSWGDCGFRVSGTSESFVFAPRGRDSFYFGLFSILGAVWLSFNALRGCLAKPIVQIFGTNFTLGKVRIWTSLLQGNCISI